MGKKQSKLVEREGEVRRLEDLAARESKALEEMARINSMKNDLMGPGEEPEGPPTEPVDGFFNDPKLQNILEEISDRGQFEVYLVENGNRAKTGQFGIVEWPDRMEQIARSVGGGTFEIVFREGDGKHAGRITRTFHPKFYKKMEEEGQKPASEDRYLMLLAEMQKQSVQMAVESKKEIMELMKVMLASQSGQQGFIKSAQDVAAIAGLFDKKDMGPEKMIDLIQTGIELGTKLAVGGGEPAGLGETLINKLIDVVGKPMADVLARSVVVPATTPRATPRPGATPKALAPAISAPEIEKEQEALTAPVDEAGEVETMKKSLWYRMYVPTVIKAAAQNEDPKAWAGKILDRVPESFHAHVLDVVSKDDLLDFLSMWEPEAVKNYSTWILLVASEIKSEFEPEPVAVPAGSNGAEKAPGIEV